MSTSDSPLRVWHYPLLWVLAGLSLGLNLLLIASLLYVRWQVGKIVADMAQALGEVALDTIEYPLQISDTLKVETTVPFSDTFVVPIKATVPVDTTILFEDTVVVPINTVIPVNTTVTVPVTIPLAGTFDVEIPISTRIPVNLSVDVPISKEVPIQLEIPVDLQVEVPVESEIPINAEVPVKMDVPLSIPLGDTPLFAILDQVREAMGKLAQILGVDVE